MKASKRAVIVSAAALVALGATQAMAFENEFHGMFQTQFDLSNFNGTNNIRDNQGDTGNFGTYTPDATEKKAPTANFFEQRVRLAYIGKASDNLKLVTKFEIDYKYWGNSSYDTGRNKGGALGSDTVNIETKHAYLDLNFPSAKINTRIGMQGFDDAFKGIFASADMAGIFLSHEYTNASASAGFFRFNDDGIGSSDSLGKNTRDLYVLDGKYTVDKNVKLGAAYYLVDSDNANRDQFAYGPNDNVENLTIHTLGCTAEVVAGDLTLDGFLAYQFGEDRNSITKPESNHVSAFAANIGAKVKAGKGKLRGELLYVSGDSNPDEGGAKNSFYTPSGYGLSESGYYNNEMVVLGRDKYAMTNDGAIVYDVNNRDQGVMFASIGYDHPFSDKLTGSANIGFAAVARENSSKPLNGNGGHNASDYLGTEVNAEVGYKIYENATLTARGGYVFLGDYYKGVAANGTPDNPYDVKLIASYSF